MKKLIFTLFVCLLAFLATFDRFLRDLANENESGYIGPNAFRIPKGTKEGDLLVQGFYFDSAERDGYALVTGTSFSYDERDAYTFKVYVTTAGKVLKTVVTFPREASISPDENGIPWERSPRP